MIMVLEKLNYAWAKWNFKSSISSRRRLWMKLSRLLDNGVPIIQGLESIRNRRLKNTSPNDPTVMAIGEWLRKLHNGSSFSQAIGDWVPNDERMLIAAGESGGQLETVLILSTEIMEGKSRIKAAIFSGTVYPIVLVCLVFGMLYLFGVKVIPNFSRTVSEDKWTGMAYFMVVLSKFVQNWLWLIGISMVSMFFAFLVSLPRWDGSLRIKLDRYMPYSLYRLSVGSSWLLAFAALVRAGTQAKLALQSMQKDASPWLSNRLLACLRGINNGYSVGDSLEMSGNGFPDPEIIDDLGVYSSLSGFDEALSMLGREWIATGVEQVKVKMNILFSFAIVVVAGLLSLMVSGMIAMQLQMGTVFQHGMR